MDPENMLQASVIIPTYKRPRFLLDTIESIVNQKSRVNSKLLLLIIPPPVNYAVKLMI